jgi:DNA polymerase family B
VLTPIEEPRRRRARIVAYDLEWIPGSMRLRLIGVRDAVRYRCYRGGTNREIVEKFLDAELTNKHRGCWFYAHAGGLADLQFLLEYLIDDERYAVEMSFSGSSAVIARIRRGSHSWVFVDSLFTLKTSIKEIGELLGLEKGEVAWDAPDAELEEYNARDCEILYEGLRQFEDALIEMGSELRMTLASCAMRLFRRQYLKAPLRTNAAINKQLRPSYFGGRTEVFFKKPITDWVTRRGVRRKRPKMTSGVYGDINSCYPAAMMRAQPERLVGSLDRLPDHREGECCYFADVTVSVPEDSYIPPLPYLYEGALYFPVGQFRGWYAGPELERAMACGVQIVEVHECLVFRPFYDLARFAEDVYRKRMQARGFHKYTFKILGNSCYGKFGERSDKAGVVVNPSEAELEALIKSAEESEHDPGRERPLRTPKRYAKNHLHLITPGAWMIEREVEVPGAHVPIAANICALGRVMLHEHMTRALEEYGAKVHYCDTDGFMLPSDIVCAHDPVYCPRLISESCPGCLLGGLKREKKVRDSMYFAPKLYYILEEGGEDLVRAKGFGGICECLAPLGYKELVEGSGEYVDAGLDYKCARCGKGRGDKVGRLAFERLIGGQAAVAMRMLRIKQLFGKGETHPREEADVRKVEGGQPKRCFAADGTSRPWSVEELEAGEHKRRASR